MALTEIVGRIARSGIRPCKSRRLSLVAKHGAELRRFLSQVMHESASVIVCREETLNATESSEDFNWTFTRLNASGWEASLSTGAVAHMSYQEAKRYSELYALQRLFNENMDRYVQKRGEMYALLSLTKEAGKPAPDLELEAGKHSIAEEIVVGDFLREIGHTLAEQYRQQKNEFSRCGSGWKQ